MKQLQTTHIIREPRVQIQVAQAVRTATLSSSSPEKLEAFAMGNGVWKCATSINASNGQKQAQLVSILKIAGEMG